MQQTDTLNNWLKMYGYHWRPGMEQMDKASYTLPEAKDKLEDLRKEGAIFYVGHPK